MSFRKKVHYDKTKFVQTNNVSLQLVEHTNEEGVTRKETAYCPVQSSHMEYEEAKKLMSLETMLSNGIQPQQVNCKVTPDTIDSQFDRAQLAEDTLYNAMVEQQVEDEKNTPTPEPTPEPNKE